MLSVQYTVMLLSERHNNLLHFLRSLRIDLPLIPDLIAFEQPSLFNKHEILISFPREASLTRNTVCHQLQVWHRITISRSGNATGVLQQQPSILEQRLLHARMFRARLVDNAVIESASVV